MRWGCCGDSERLQAIAGAGYDYAESPVRALCIGKPVSDAQPFFDAARASRLSIEALNVFVSAEQPIVGPNVNEEDLRSHVHGLMARIEDLNTSIIVLGSGGARAIPEGWDPQTARDQFVSFCSLVADLVADTGLTIVIEPLAEAVCNYIHTVGEALDLADEVDRPEVAALADLYHMHMNDDPIENLAPVANRLKHVHLPVPTLPGVIDSDLTFDHSGYLAALKAGGYDDRISVEDNGRRFTDCDLQAKPVLDYLKQTWDSL